MNTEDRALTMSRPRLLAAIYFALLSVAGTIIINAILDSIGIEQIVPIYKMVLWGMIVAACTGAVFGEHIIHAAKPYKAKTFWLGFAMIMASLPVFDLGLLLLMSEEHAKLFSVAKLHDFVYFYFVILAYSYVLFGVFLAIISGLAALYLRDRLVYDILHTQERRKRGAKTKQAESNATHTHEEHAPHRKM
ncbi:hypothetical protein [Legionella worsleiensis]|uniref:Transmembrane protein n=1 Tax=Legionella worsleiensis TaxID=45076 RepID=A0A0W1AKS5_9GAMM|nr:hypothetical protein [Legionella worsleiensis]KTD81963.1 hypothetical protein Lwor_0266 [Legionella worsleiensis]STY31337.1 Uncharacterised protein [Legionella worsleiensis]